MANLHEEIRRVCMSLVAAEEQRLLIAAKAVDTGQDPLVVHLPEYSSPTIHPAESDDPNMLSFRVTLNPTGRLILYIVPRTVFEELNRKFTSQLAELDKVLVDDES